jgi:hypothetical protein
MLQVLQAEHDDYMTQYSRWAYDTERSLLLWLHLGPQAPQMTAAVLLM